eukprot:TRINITY_DN1860_c0_g1_i7.p2 TRINITY_DN1860_c0_g1~~TRINITY_DN1860_c0_g1_i7.p2  ORF type:complete len:215 (-),score=34.65 TRINITY_DN1860_c0_g1_i7:128-772(-)
MPSLVGSEMCIRDRYQRRVHGHDLALAAVVQIGTVQRLGVFLAQLENMTDFDAAQYFQGALAVRRGVAGDDVANVEDFRFRQVAAEIDACHVIPGFVGATDEIAHVSHATIGKNGHLRRVDCNRANESGLAAEALDHFFFGGEAERIDGGNFACLDFVQFMVAAQQQQGESLAAIFLLAHHGDRFDDPVERQLQEFGDIGTSHLARRVGLVHRL